MAKQFQGWVDDRGFAHPSQEAAEAADLAVMRSTAEETIKRIVYKAIDWRDQRLDVSKLIENAATLTVNIEALAQPD